jgi:RNA polymerase sigma-70 factor (ECF subfamily)
MPLLPHSDTEELLRRAAGGDNLARDQVWNRYRPRLHRMVSLRIDRRIASRVDPSDVVQEALAVADRRLPEYVAGPPMAFYPWLRRIAWDRLLAAYRTHIDAERRSVLKERPPILALSPDSVDALAHHLEASSFAPNNRALRAELHARVIDALAELKPRDREILVLRYLEQMSVPEIAEALELSYTAVTSCHLRALQRLRRVLRDDLKE